MLQDIDIDKYNTLRLAHKHKIRFYSVFVDRDVSEAHLRGANRNNWEIKD